MSQEEFSSPVRMTHIRESNLIEGFDDPEIDKASSIAWRQLKARLKRHPLTHADIQQLNAQLTAHQPELDDMWRGAYRSRSRARVWIGGKEGMKPAHVARAMDDWLEQYYTADPIKHHVEFEHIHPFIDGNGRTGRMLMWLMQQDRGEKPTLIYKSKVSDYYKWF